MARVSRWLAVLALLALGCGRPSVLVLGIDSGDWDVIDTLTASGHLPTLRAIVNASARADLDCYAAMPETACFCPPVWMTVFTGHDWAHHGYSSWEQESSARRVKALWNVLADHGGTSTLVAGRGTWPPEPDASYVLTEAGLDAAAHLIYRAWGSTQNSERLALIDDWTRPSDLFTTLGVLPVATQGPDVWRPIASDRVAMDSLTRLATQLERTDLTMITLHSPDRTGHVHWGWIQAITGAPINQDNLRAIADIYTGPIEGPKPFSNGTVASQYQELDAWLGQHLALVPYKYIVLVSDHGMSRSPPTATLTGGHGVNLPEAHSGIFAVWGPGVRAGAVLDEVSILDVAPTIAYLLNLPVADDLPGRVVTEAFVPERFDLRPIISVPTWE